MKALAFIGTLVVVLTAIMFALGWLSVSNQGSTASVTLDKARAERDSRAALSKVKQLGNDVTEKVDDSIRNPSHPQ